MSDSDNDHDKTHEDGDTTPAALPPRRPYPIARYPRKLKLAASGGFILLVIAAYSGSHWLAGYAHRVREDAKPRQANLHALDIDTSAQPVAADPVSPGDAAPILESLNDQDDRSLPLLKAPDPALNEEIAQGNLPRIGADGRQPWQAYARPFNQADKRPRIAIVITDLGLSKIASDEATTRLPANIDLAFDTQSPQVGAWSARARQDGHETLMIVPMEPFDYPRSDPGPDTLLSNLSNSDNIQRLDHALRQATGYIGVTTLSGSRLTMQPEKIQPILDALKSRGLMFFDAKAAPHSVAPAVAQTMHLPAAEQTVAIDQTPTPQGIDRALAELERQARKNGSAIGIAAPLPVVIDRIEAWSKQLPGHGIALAPLSAVVKTNNPVDVATVPQAAK